jgi:hypothetical protein
VVFDDQQIQTDFISHIDVETQYELDLDIPDTAILPIIFSEELPVSNEIEIVIEDEEIEIEKKIFVEQECQTIIINDSIQSDEHTQTPHIYLNDCASQSLIITYEDRSIQTEVYSNLYSSSLYIIPSSIDQSCCSSTIVIMPKENQCSSSILIDQETQCNLDLVETIIPIETEKKIKNQDKRTILQQQMDEKEKQMNRIIGMIHLKSLAFFCRG